MNLDWGGMIRDHAISKIRGAVEIFWSYHWMKYSAANVSWPRARQRNKAISALQESYRSSIWCVRVSAVQCVVNIWEEVTSWVGEGKCLGEASLRKWHSPDEDTEVQRGEINCPRTHNRGVIGLRIQLKPSGPKLWLLPGHFAGTCLSALGKGGIMVDWGSHGTGGELIWSFLLKNLETVA